MSKFRMDQRVMTVHGHKAGQVTKMLLSKRGRKYQVLFDDNTAGTYWGSELLSENQLKLG